MTNSREKEKTQVSVEKIWNDSDNKGNFRPANVTVKLLANGKEAGTVELNAENEWKHTWTDLQKYANSAEIQYTVAETQVPGYIVPAVKKISEDEWAYTITNTYTYVKVSKQDITGDDELPGATQPCRFWMRKATLSEHGYLLTSLLKSPAWRRMLSTPCVKPSLPMATPLPAIRPSVSTARAR